MCRADECVQNRRKCSSCVEREEELLYQIHPHPWWFSQNHEPNTAQRTKHFSAPSSQLINPSQDVPWNKFPWKNRILTLWRRGLGRKCTIIIPSFINHLCNAKLCHQPHSLPWTPSSPSFPAGKSSEPGLRVLCIPRAFPGHCSPFSSTASGCFRGQGRFSSEPAHSVSLSESQAVKVLRVCAFLLFPLLFLMSSSPPIPVHGVINELLTRSGIFLPGHNSASVRREAGMPRARAAAFAEAELAPGYKSGPSHCSG